MSLDYYYKLSDLDSEIRLSAAQQLITELIEKDKEEDWSYALKRLVRGLSSPRLASRLGFSMALTELLSVRASKLSIKDILDLLKRELKAPSSMTATEQRDLHFGMLFGLQSVAASSLFNTNHLNLEDYSSVVSRIILLSLVKSWIREPCFLVINRIISLLGDITKENEEGLSYANAIDYILDEIETNNLGNTPEYIATYLSIDQSMPLSPAFKSRPHPLLKAELLSLAKILKEAPSSRTGDGQDNAQSAQSGHWNATINLAWPHILEFYVHKGSSSSSLEELQRPKKKQKKRKSSQAQEVQLPSTASLEEFWKVVVDESLFANSASPERKFWGFEVFKLFLNGAVVGNLPKSSIQSLFSPNFMRTLINQLAKSDRFLNKAAKQVATTIQQIVSEHPQYGGIICKCLVVDMDGKTINFDRATKSKTVEGLLKQVSNDDPEQACEILEGLISTAPRDPGQAEIQRQWAADQLLHIFRSHKAQFVAKPKTVERILFMMTIYGYLEVSDAVLDDVPAVYQDVVSQATLNTDPVISKSSRTLFADRLSSIIVYLMSVNQHNVCWTYKVVKFISEMNTSAKFQLVFPVDKSIAKVRDRALKTLDRIQRKRSSSPHADTAQLQAFELLFSQVVLDLYRGQPDAVGLLEELHTIYNTTIPAESTSTAALSSKDSKKRKRSADESEPDLGDGSSAAQALTEILISFLSRKSSLLRKLAETVWSSYTSTVDGPTLSMLTAILQTKESRQGQDELFDVEQDEEEEADEDMIDGESDIEISREEEEAEGDMNEADKALNEALAKALQVDSNEDSSSVDSSEEEEELMDDDQMMALDEQISQIFRERRAFEGKSNGEPGSGAAQADRRKSAREAKENMIQLKQRVLGLLEIFIKQESSSILNVDLVLPLLNLVGSTTDASLADRAHNLIKNRLCKVKPIPKIESANQADEIFDHVFKQIHFEAIHKSKTGGGLHALALGQCSIFIAKILIGFDRLKYIPLIIDVYGETLKNWMLRKSLKIKSSIFLDFINWANTLRLNQAASLSS